MRQVLKAVAQRIIDRSTDVVLGKRTVAGAVGTTFLVENLVSHRLGKTMSGISMRRDKSAMVATRRSSGCSMNISFVA